MDRIASGLRHLEVFGMHFMPLDVIHPQRLKGSGADVQGHECVLHPPLLKCGKDILVEVQARRRRGNRARRPRKHALVTVAIGGFGRSIDIGGQRHIAVSFKERQHIAREPEAVKVAGPAEHVCAVAAGQIHPRLEPQALAGARMHQRRVGSEHALEQ